MRILGRLLWWYVNTLFGAICFGTHLLWSRWRLKENEASLAEAKLRTVKE